MRGIVCAGLVAIVGCSEGGGQVVIEETDCERGDVYVGETIEQVCEVDSYLLCVTDDREMVFTLAGERPDEPVIACVIEVDHHEHGTFTFVFWTQEHLRNFNFRVDAGYYPMRVAWVEPGFKLEIHRK